MTLTPTVGHCRDVLVFARRHLVTAQKAGEAHEEAWAELAALRKALARLPREQPVTKAFWTRCRKVGNATGQASKAWWNARRWGGTRPD